MDDLFCALATDDLFLMKSARIFLKIPFDVQNPLHGVKERSAQRHPNQMATRTIYVASTIAFFIAHGAWMAGPFEKCSRVLKRPFTVHDSIHRVN